MNDMWTGGKVRLRGVEPEDWKGFRDRPGTLPTHAQPTRSSPAFRRELPVLDR